MPKELYNTPYDNAPCPTPSAGDGTVIGQRGGAEWPTDDMGKQGLVGTPFEKQICQSPGGKETANASELGTLPYTMDVKEGPAPWSHVDVEPGVASPAVAVTHMDKR